MWTLEDADVGRSRDQGKGSEFYSLSYSWVLPSMCSLRIFLEYLLDWLLLGAVRRPEDADCTPLHDKIPLLSFRSAHYNNIFPPNTLQLLRFHWSNFLLLPPGILTHRKEPTPTPWNYMCVFLGLPTPVKPLLKDWTPCCFLLTYSFPSHTPPSFPDEYLAP